MASYDREDMRPDPAGTDLANLVMDQNTRSRILEVCRKSGADPVFFPYDPFTAMDMTDFLRNPQRGGKSVGRIKIVKRQVLLTFNATNPTQLLKQKIELAGGDNLVIMQCVAAANNASSAIYDINLFDLAINDGQGFPLLPRSPLHLYAGYDAGLPAKFLPEPWRGTNTRQVDAYQRTGTTPVNSVVINLYLNFTCAQVDTNE